MIKSLKKIILILFVVVLLGIPFGAADSFAHTVAEETNEKIRITTNLKDHTTKSDRLTFDVWVRNQDNQKVNASNVRVTNNDKPVAINWDDDEKTSYTVLLDIGENHVNIEVNDDGKVTVESFLLVREAAQDGDVIGKYIFSLEAFTIGLGYIIEPIEVDLIKGRKASHELDQLLRNYGFSYENTGTLESSFYFAHLVAEESEIYKVKPSISEPLKIALDGQYDEENYFEESLGEFDFNSLSGWMYAVNNIFPNVGFADYYLSEEDVMRVQYTIALGADIGGGWGNNFFNLVNKDLLTRKVAQINSSDAKDELLANPIFKEAYHHAYKVLQTVDVTQSEIDLALKRLDEFEKQRLEAQSVIE